MGSIMIEQTPSPERPSYRRQLRAAVGRVAERVLRWATPERIPEIEDKARLDGALLAGHTAAHHLNNDIGIMVGGAELINNEPGLPPHIKDFAQSILAGGKQAAEHIGRMRRLNRIVLIDHGTRVTPTIDLEKSTLPPSSEHTLPS